jgi:hypothetical protein
LVTFEVIISGLMVLLARRLAVRQKCAFREVGLAGRSMKQAIVRDVRRVRLEGQVFRRLTRIKFSITAERNNSKTSWTTWTPRTNAAATAISVTPLVGPMSDNLDKQTVICEPQCRDGDPVPAAKYQHQERCRPWGESCRGCRPVDV